MNLEQVESDSDDETVGNDEDEEYEPPIQRSTKKRGPKITDPSFFATLDRAGLSQRKSTMVTASYLQATGTSLSDVTFSNSTLNRERQKFRRKIGKY